MTSDNHLSTSLSTDDQPAKYPSLHIQYSSFCICKQIPKIDYCNVYVRVQFCTWYNLVVFFVPYLTVILEGEVNAGQSLPTCTEPAESNCSSLIH